MELRKAVLWTKDRKAGAPIGLRTPCSLAVVNSLASTSIAMMSSMGERESPCRTPLLCLMGFPSRPFNMMHDVADENRVATHLRHCSPKPNACSVFSRKGQATVSNALEMSSLSSTFGILFLCRYTTALWTNLKLSWIVRPRMKAF